MLNVMKKYISFLLFTFVSSTIFCQNALGLTKSEIISKYDKCRIISNDSSLLILNCDELSQFYSFDHENKLCIFYGFEIPYSRLENFKSQILNRGYTFFATLDSYPIILALGGGNKNKTTPADIYENKKFVISLLKYDLVGNDSSRKIGIYIEYYKKEMFEK
jgi:hypothetical protein